MYWSHNCRGKYLIKVFLILGRYSPLVEAHHNCRKGHLVLYPFDSACEWKMHNNVYEKGGGLKCHTSLLYSIYEMCIGYAILFKCLSQANCHI